MALANLLHLSKCHLPICKTQITHPSHQMPVLLFTVIHNHSAPMILEGACLAQSLSGNEVIAGTGSSHSLEIEAGCTKSSTKAAEALCAPWGSCCPSDANLPTGSFPEMLQSQASLLATLKVCSTQHLTLRCHSSWRDLIRTGRRREFLKCHS